MYSLVRNQWIDCYVILCQDMADYQVVLKVFYNCFFVFNEIFGYLNC